MVGQSKLCKGRSDRFRGRLEAQVLLSMTTILRVRPALFHLLPFLDVYCYGCRGKVVSL